MSREETIKGLQYTIEMCLFNPTTGHSKDPNDLNEADRITYDACISAIALLKEQEAVKPKLVGPSMWRCGKCDELLGWEDFTPSGVELVEYKFCPKCGRPVKWE